jgi:hypothetical protein
MIVFTGCDDNLISNLSQNGKAGSMARFGMTSTHLYSVDNLALNVYRIGPNGALTQVNDIVIGFGVETIFPYGDKLFIGTNDGMYTYDITRPEEPVLVSQYDHIVSCDPVVVQDTIAYVTLRALGCRANGVNVMDIINIKDPTNPMRIKSVAMQSPYGLGIDGNVLFVCQGDYGLDVYDVSKRADPKLIKTYKDIHAFDVIPHNGTLIMTGNNGITQYDYRGGVNNVKSLSTIAVQNEHP